MAEKQNISAAQVGEVKELSEFESLLSGSFSVKEGSEKESAVKNAVKTLAQQALSNEALISEDALQSIESLIAAIDQKLSEQINEILHNDEFQKLEGTWRGLHHLVSNTETDEKLKLRVFNISKKELGKTFKKFPGSRWDQSPLFKKIYGAEYDTPGGEPFSCLVGDYAFDHSAPDLEVLKGVAKLAGASHSPFITSPAPTLFDLEDWTEVNNPAQLKPQFQRPEYAGWRSFRESDDSKYIGMAMPRFLARVPYGPTTNPVDEFHFEETTDGSDHGRYCWANSAFAMATNITRSFKHFGMCTSIRGAESGGAVEGLPVHTFPTADGKSEMKCPTEVAIGDRREKELSDLGMLPLQHWKNTDYAVFVGGQSLQEPSIYADDADSANAQLAARLPYLFATCRFAHYLKMIAREKVGSFMERDDMQTFLNNWINQYVVDDPSASQDTKARFPLAAAEVTVAEVPGNPGYYTSRFALRPHYQLEGLSASLSLVSQLPSVRKGS
ncbi:MAG: type VI secretion system contractile sheath large subunit [Opitutaceae bacterium]